MAARKLSSAWLRTPASAGSPVTPAVRTGTWRGMRPNLFPASTTWHPLLMEVVSGIPDVQAGRLRVVALRHDPFRRPGRGTSRAGATSCTSRRPRGARATSATALPSGRVRRPGLSPSDFPDENYERTWADRFHGGRPQRHRPARPEPRRRPPGRPHDGGRRSPRAASTAADRRRPGRGSALAWRPAWQRAGPEGRHHVAVGDQRVDRVGDVPAGQLDRVLVVVARSARPIPGGACP